MEGWAESPEGEFGGCVYSCSMVYISGVGGSRGGTLEWSAVGGGHVGAGSQGQQVQDPDHTLIGAQIVTGPCVLWVALCWLCLRGTRDSRS